MVIMEMMSRRVPRADKAATTCRIQGISKLQPTPKLTETMAMAIQRAEAGRGTRKAQMSNIDSVAVTTFHTTSDRVDDCWSTNRKLQSKKAITKDHVWAWVAYDMKRVCSKLELVGSEVRRRRKV